MKRGSEGKSFLERVDPEVVTSFALYLVKVIEIDPEALVKSPHFPQIMGVFCDTLIYVTEKEL